MLARPRRPAAHVHVHAAKAGLSFFPKARAHDGEFRIFVGDPFLFGTHDAPAALAAGDANPLRLVPDEAPDVALVAEHRANSRVAPAVAVLVAAAAIIWRRKPFLVQ